MIRLPFALAAIAVFAAPVTAQEAVPLLRVYIDTPYYYEILAIPDASNDAREQRMTLLVEGKEVGESVVALDCKSGDYSEEVVTDWTGSAPDFVPAALQAYRNLFC
jgi:hypothetical protein